MVVGDVLHEGDALAHRRMAEDDCRNVGGRGLFQRLVELRVVVAAALDYLPTVGGPERGDVYRHNLFEPSADLYVVPVDYRREARELFFHCYAARLGDLSLDLLAVAHDDPRARLRAASARRESEADAGGEPLPEVARAPVHAGNVALDVALVRAASAAEVRRHLLRVEEAVLRERRVEARGGVSVAHDDAVALRRVRELGRNVCGAEQRHIYIHRRQRAGRMAALRRRRRDDGPHARAPRRLRKLRGSLRAYALGPEIAYLFSDVHCINSSPRRGNCVKTLGFYSTTKRARCGKIFLRAARTRVLTKARAGALIGSGKRGSPDDGLRGSAKLRPLNLTRVMPP